MVKHRIFFGLALALLAGGAVRGGELSVQMAPKTGLTITSKAMGPVSAVSRLIVVEPPWLEKWFSNQITKVEVENRGDFAGMKQLENRPFALEEYSAAVEGDGNTVRLRFSGALTEEVPAVYEYSAICVPGLLLAGANCTVTHYDGATESVIIPEAPAKSSIPFINNAKKLEFSGRYGTLTVEVLKGTLLEVVDRRGVPFENVECFWIAKNNVKLPYGEKLESEILFTFVPADAASSPDPLPAVASPVSPLPTTPATVVEERKYQPVELNFARPKLVSAAQPLPEADAPVKEIVFENVPEVDQARLAKAFEKTGLLNPDGKRTLTITLRDADFTYHHPEGYRIVSTPEALAIASPTARGAFYAIQTLRDPAWKNQSVRIDDYPDLDFRGIHLLSAEETPTYHKFCVEELFSRGKINSIVMECQRVQWEATRELWQPRSLSKAGLEEFLQVCADNYIEVIPLFQTLGHSEWLFYNGIHRDWAEDPDRPYAYNVSHPDVYPYIDRAIEEAIEAFHHPRYFHIGHDEVDMIGRYPHQPENVARGMPDLIMSDIMHLYTLLKKHGARLMMWHDMIEASGECYNASGMRLPDVKPFRDALPKDIIIADWQYSGDRMHAEFADVKRLMDEGFTVIGCTWYDPANVNNFSRAVKKHHAWGLLQTTWTGYTAGWNSFEKDFYQISPYLQAAALAWSDDGVPDPAAMLNDVLLNEAFDDPAVFPPESHRAKTGELVDISSVANIEISDENDPFMLGSALGLPEALPAGGTVKAGRFAFLLPARNGKLAAVAVQSQPNIKFPKSVTLPLETTADAVNLFASHIAAAAPKFEQAVAELVFNYSDGTHAAVPLKYNITAGSFHGVGSKYLNRTSGGDFGEGRLWATRIENPEREKEITSLTLKSLNLPFYLFGLSLEK